MREAWQVLHHHLVALQLLELRTHPSNGSLEESVLLAEICIEGLTADVEAVRDAA